MSAPSKALPARRESEKTFQSTAHESMTSDEAERQERALPKRAPVLPLRGPHYGQRLKASIRRWWWLHLLILSLVFLIVILPLLYVGFPNIAQDGIDGATLSIDGMRVTQATPDSFHLELNSTIRSSAAQHPNLDAFEGALYLEDDPSHTPFAYVQFPAVKAQAETPVNVSQIIRVTDQTRQAFGRYNEAVLLRESYRVAVDGYARLHYLAFPDTTVHFQHTTEVKGLNSFKGLTTTDLRVLLVPDERGDNFFANVHIPNESNLEVHLGNTTFVNALDGKDVGYTYFDDFVLYPGDNVLAIRSAVESVPILTALSSQPYCESGILPVVFTGQTVANAQGQALDYFQSALRKLSVHQSLDVGSAVAHAPGGARISCLPPKNNTSGN